MIKDLFSVDNYSSIIILPPVDINEQINRTISNMVKGPQGSIPSPLALQYLIVFGGIIIILALI